MAIFKGDVGTKLIIDVGISVDEINVAKIYVRKPNGVEVEWAAAKEPGTSQIYYITKDGDVDVSGTYRLQPYLELSSGWKGRGSSIIMEVKDVI